MRFVSAAVVVAVLVASLAAWVLSPRVSPTADRHALKPAPPAPVSELPKTAQQGRRLLTQAQVDQALASGTLDRPVKSLLAVRAPMRFGDFEWNDEAIPNAPTWVRVDLGAQLISVFRGGNEIGTAVIVYGGDNKETPAGKFHVLAKDSDHRSSIYDAKMPFTLQLTGDGVSIHGSSVRWGAATHGCIGVPLDFARKLFAETKVGDEVVIIPPPAKRVS